MSDEMIEGGTIPDPEMPASPAEPVGHILRKARIGRGWDVDDIDRITHISPGWVIVIENGDWGQYPSMVYAKGHVRAYADALDLDVLSIMEDFQREWDKKVIPEGHDAQLLNRSGISGNEGRGNQKSVLVMLTVVGMLVMVVVAVRYAVSSRSKSSKETTMVNPPISAPTPKIETAVPPSVSEKSLSPSPETHGSLPAGATIPEAVQGEKKSTQTNANNAKTVPMEGLVATEKAALTLKMVALKSTWVVISVDDGTVRRFHLMSGESKTLSGKNFMTFSTGIGNGLVLFLNGKRLGLAGLTADPVMHRRITHNSFRTQKKLQKKALPGLPKTGVINPKKTTVIKSQPSQSDATHATQLPSPGIMPLVPSTPAISPQSNPSLSHTNTTNQSGGLP